MRLKLPLRMSIVGATMCGKTYFVLDTLKKHFDNGREFDIILWVSPTTQTNIKDIEKLKTKDGEDVMILEEWDSEVIKEVFNKIKAENKKRLAKKRKPLQSLFVFDDLADNKQVMNCHSATLVDKMYQQGRHHFISVILISQQYSALSQCLRCINQSHLVVKNVNAKALEKIAEEHCPLFIGNVTKFQQAISDHLTKNLYGHVIIDYTVPAGPERLKTDF